LSRPASQRIDSAEAGFTIIEVLIALAIVGVCIVAIGLVMSTNARGVRSLEQHVALIQATRSVMVAGIPQRANLAPGELAGRLNDHHWQIDIGQLGGGWIVPEADGAWIPELINIRVQSPTGGTYSLQTIRLMHRPSQ
jgi:general secretion pathway protein I